MTTQTQPKSATRTIERTLRINAPIDTVWKALTDAAELVRWFPVDAKVKPGAGGSMEWSWGPTVNWPLKIESWDPPRHLRLSDSWVPADAQGTSAGPLLVDFTLEGAGGVTTLHLVHSGFGFGASWEPWYNATSCGWLCELTGLKHYVERHLGQTRKFIWARRGIKTDLATAWRRLIGPQGLALQPGETALAIGSAVALTVGALGRLEGTILSHKEGLALVIEVGALNHARFLINVDVSCDGQPGTYESGIRVSLYGDAMGRTNEVTRASNEALARVFPD